MLARRVAYSSFEHMGDESIGNPYVRQHKSTWTNVQRTTGHKARVVVVLVLAGKDLNEQSSWRFTHRAQGV